MSKASDLDNLARAYLDLWQDQLTAMAADPATADAVARLFGAMTSGWMNLAGGAGQAFASTMSGPLGGRDERGHEPSTAQDVGSREPGDGAAPPGPAAAAAPPVDRDRGVHELLERIAALEKRLDALEQADRGPGSRAGRSARQAPRKRKS